MKFSFFALGVFAIVASVWAGPVELEPKEEAPAPTITDNDHWYFNIGMPGWIPFISADIGLHGASSSAQVDPSQIITHLTGVVSLSAEARKGRFGVYGDLIYMSCSDGIYRNGLVKKADITLNQYIADGEVYYRVWESQNGSLDLRAGARYTNSFSRLELTGADAKIDMAAAAFVTAANGDLRDLLERLLNGALDPSHPPLPFPPLGAGVKRQILKLIIAARQNPVGTQQRITRILKTHLNKGYGLTEFWTDPYVGFRGEYELKKPFYVTGKADVGGFDVNSTITAQGYCGLGDHLTRNIYLELGFRVLYDDYKNGGYSYKSTIYGPQITLGASF